jgi:hypothetical protein
MQLTGTSRTGMNTFPPITKERERRFGERNAFQAYLKRARTAKIHCINIQFDE